MARFILSRCCRKSADIFLLIFLATVAACSSLPQDTLLLTDPHQPLKATYFDTDIYSFDGTKLKATVYRPALKAGEVAPVLIHSHGVAVFRMSGPVSIYAKMILSGEAAIEAWKQGYWVVSYDHRGHGESEGSIHVMDPAYEGRDLSSVIDWSVNNLPRVLFKDKDPVVGILGESYGGAAALLGATLDSRIDAVVPFNTWHNLKESLYPNRVAKSGWLTTLIVAVNVLNPGDLDPLYNRAYLDARKGFVREDVLQAIEDHAPQYYCDAGQVPNADILLVQGFRDVLFPINQAVKNFQCAKRSGRDIRLIGAQKGHLLPFSQFSVVPAYSLEEHVFCDGKKLSLIDMTVGWFDEKLKGREGAASQVPTVCLTQDETSGVTFSDVPIGGQSFALQQTNIQSGFAGFFEMPMRWVDQLKSFFSQEKHTVFFNELEGQGGNMRPAFMPLTVAESTGTMSGIPLAELNIQDNHYSQPIIFVGVGVKRKNSDQLTLVSDQITPIKGTGIKKLELAGISIQLNKGDIVGLVIKSYSDQYRFSGSGWLTQANVSGKVALPIQADSSVMPSSSFASRQMLMDRVINNE
jgi:ABC-2 type transport system ATP-binding protein